MTGTACSLVSVVGSRDHTLIRSWARTTMEELVGGVGGWLWAGWTGASLVKQERRGGRLAQGRRAQRGILLVQVTGGSANRCNYVYTYVYSRKKCPKWGSTWLSFAYKTVN